MFKNMFVKTVALTAAALLPAAVFADNCFINGSSVPVPHPTSDPAPSVFTYGGVTKVYFYCTQDIVGLSGTYPIDTVACYSSTDMYHWKHEGVSLDEDRVPWANHNVHKLWAPSVVYLKNRYRLTVPATHTDGYFYNFMATSSHPVGDNAYGQYTAGPVLPGSVRNVIDPFVFIDPDDSTVWMSYRHQNGSDLGFVRMDDSATRITGDINNCIQYPGSGVPSGYREGSWIWKRGSMYYLVFAQVPGSGNEIIAYSTATSYNGPWTYRGQIFSQNNSPSEFTIHSGACEYQRQTYIFWHNVTFGGQIFGSERCSGIEYLTYTTGNLINTATISKTNRGVGVPSAYNDSLQIDRGVLTNCSSAAWAYNASTTEARASWYLTSISSGDVVRYDSVDFGSSTNIPNRLIVRVASTSTGGTITARVDGTSGPIIGTSSSISSTGSLTTYATQTLTLSGATATAPLNRRNLYLSFTSPTANTYNVNWLQFGYVTETAPDMAQAKASGLACRRAGRNMFVIDVPEGAAVSKVRIFNLAGREIANAFNSTFSPKRLAVNLNAGALASGSYMLEVKSSAGEKRVPFTF
ncbi:MAG: family 43 glycosylhydrolase [Chitinispirillaceae bacterium]|nr:family 43 glycosylhydrolase [Chitinispirillaceae bacterium]